MLMAEEAVEIRVLRRQGKASGRSRERWMCRATRCDVTCGSKDCRGTSLKRDQASSTPKALHHGKSKGRRAGLDSGDSAAARAENARLRGRLQHPEGSSRDPATLAKPEPLI
jgi:hypothetical protein